jgi:hypothetical protein
VSTFTRASLLPFPRSGAWRYFSRFAEIPTSVEEPELFALFPTMSDDYQGGSVLDALVDNNDDGSDVESVHPSPSKSPASDSIAGRATSSAPQSPFKRRRVASGTTTSSDKRTITPNGAKNLKQVHNSSSIATLMVSQRMEDRPLKTVGCIECNFKTVKKNDL